MRWRLVYLGVGIVALAGAATTASAQGVQAIRNAAGSVHEVAQTGIPRDSALLVLGGLRSALATIALADAIRKDPALSGLTEDLGSRVDEAISARNDPTRFASALRDVRRGLDELRVELEAARERSAAAVATAPDSARRTAEFSAQQQLSTGVAQLNSGVVRVLSGGVGVSQVTTLVPSVVFTVGPTYDFRPRSSSVFAGRQPGIASVGVSTNLLGAAAGSAFSGLGAESFGTYLTNNISVGTSVPSTGAARISANLSLGLGGVSIGKWLTLWPAIQIQQLDSADARVPLRSVLGNVSSQQWSSPVFGVAFVFGTDDVIKKRLEAKQLVLIPIIGLQLPYYYPGDSFTALAALFSSRRSSFVRTGPARWNVGLAIPLLKVGGDSGTESPQPKT